MRRGLDLRAMGLVLSLALSTSGLALAQSGTAPGAAPGESSAPPALPDSPAAPANAAEAPQSPEPSSPAPVEPTPASPVVSETAPAPAAESAPPTADPAGAQTAPTSSAAGAASTPPVAGAAPATAPAEASSAAPPDANPSPSTQAAPEAAPLKKPKPLQFAITWDLVLPIRMPLQPTSAGFFGGVGYQAFSLDVRYWVEDKIAIGGMVGWHTLNNKTVTSFEGDDGVTQTGNTYMEANMNEILGRVHYAMADRAAARAYAPPPGKKAELGKQIIPMIALGAGAARFVQTLDTGLARSISERWMVALVPELGVEFPTKMLPIILAGRLHYFFGSSVGPEELYATLSLGGAFE